MLTRHTQLRTAVLSAALLTAACGGGGGGDGASDGPLPTISTDTSRIEVITSTQEHFSKTESFLVNLSEPIDFDIAILAETDSAALIDFEVFPVDDRQAQIDFYFVPGAEHAPGFYDSQIVMRFCADDRCKRELPGSPLVLQINYIVGDAGTGSAETEPEPPAFRTLPADVIHRFEHDVQGSAYSAPLDALVTISTFPAHQLHLLDLGSGREHSVQLAAEAKQLSISPDGLTAAVSHGSSLSMFDLTELRDQGTTSPTSIAHTMEIQQLAMADAGVIHMLVLNGNRKQLDTLDTTASELTSFSDSRFAPRGNEVMRLSPDGERLSFGVIDFHFSRVVTLAVDGIAVSYLAESRYGSDIQTCGENWFSPDNQRIYTACGSTLISSDQADENLRYSGSLDLATPGITPYRVAGLSHSATADEIFAVQRPYAECRNLNAEDCTSVISLYDGDHLLLLEHFELTSMAVGNTQYRQLGMQAFHRADGDQKLLLSKLQGMPNPEFEYYLSAVDLKLESPAAVAEIDQGPYPPPQVEHGIAPLKVKHRQLLNHQVVDAAFSSALNALITVSRYPRPALHALDMASGSVTSVELERDPVDLSLSPDGLTAAVGADALISHVDLAALVGSGSSTPRHTGLAMQVGQLTVDNVGRAHVFPKNPSNEVSAVSVDLAPGIVTRAGSLFWSDHYPVFAASQNAIYSVNEQRQLMRLDVSAPAMVAQAVSSSSLSSSTCRGLWLREDESQLITACGSVFGVSGTAAQDMKLISYIRPTDSRDSYAHLEHVAHSSVAGAIALIERAASSACGDSYISPYVSNPCRTRLALLDDQFLQQTDQFAINPILVDNKLYTQKGLFVFFAPSGNQLILISKLIGTVNPDAKYYLSIIDLDVD